MNDTEQQASRRPEYLGDPTVARVAVRPKWIAALLLALLVAAGFAWLGRWQLDNAIRTDTFDSVEFETPRPLSDLVKPGGPVGEAAGGAVVHVAGTLRADDLQIVAPRDNAGERGAWVVGHLAIPEGGATAHLAVALGWAPSTAAAEQAIDVLSQSPELAGEWQLEGRFMPPEGPSVPEPHEDPSLIKNMVPAYLVNVWNGVDGKTYGGYLVTHPVGDIAGLIDSVGLDPIDSVAPEPPEAVNWLNVFYALEWIIFAGFAVFFWFRLVRDDWERTHEAQLLQSEAALAERSDSAE